MVTKGTRGADFSIHKINGIFFFCSPFLKYCIFVFKGRFPESPEYAGWIGVCEIEFSHMFKTAADPEGVQVRPFETKLFHFHGYFSKNQKK